MKSKIGALARTLMPTNPKTVDLIYIFTALLVPIIPAFIFYRWFSSTAEASAGQNGSGFQFLRGIGFKLGGAFAGYFILMLVILRCRPPILPPSADEIWTVSGKIDSEPEIVNADEITFKVSPRTFEPLPDKTFTAKILVPQKNDRPDYPILMFERLQQGQTTFESATVHLDGTGTYTVSFPRNTDREMHVNEPIKLPKSTRPYDGSGQPPTPTSRNQ